MPARALRMRGTASRRMGMPGLLGASMEAVGVLIGAAVAVDAAIAVGVGTAVGSGV